MFKKKPVAIEAKQWFEPGHADHDPSMLSNRTGLGDLYCSPRAGTNTYRLRTLEGDMVVSDGDWIITGVQGEKYPCKPDIFEQTYEPVSEMVSTKPDIYGSDK